MTDVYAPTSQHGVNREALEMQAFEKGRIQGELEATRRMEAESHLHAKQMVPVGPTAAELDAINQLQRPDVVEINRLTWLQRLTWALGNLTALGMIALICAWAIEWRDSFDWFGESADIGGHPSMLNVFLLVGVLGLTLTAAAITHYRVFPLRTPPLINRVWYILLQCCAVTCYTIGLVAIHRAQPGETYWSAADWVYALGYAITVSHALYSMFHAVFDTCRHNRGHKGAQKFADSNNGQRMLESPEQRRDHSTHNQFGRSVYTPAPTLLHPNAGAASHNNNAPMAPANAPRWAENPQTHAEDYWLMARAKWAVVGFWCVGVGILMQLAALQHVIAAGRDGFANGLPNDQMDQSGRERNVSGVASLMILMTLALMSYTAMPPRTTLVKNGILRDPTARRTSISNNAETQLGHHNQQIV